jgi:hypothetical protein
MSNKPAGVFVRLPLSAAQREQYLDVINSGEPLEAEASALEAGILAIGTPVTGGDIPIMAHIHSGDLRNFVSAASHYKLCTVLSKSTSSAYTPLVRQSDAQAQITALEAEVVCLRERYGAIRWRFIQDARIEGRTLTERQFDALVDNDDEAHKALKGGAA